MADLPVLVVDGITYYPEPPKPHIPPAGWRPADRGEPFCERCWLAAGLVRGCRDKAGPTLAREGGE